MGTLPSVTFPSPNEWPQDQIKTITGISNARRARITSTAHGFNGDDVDLTSLTFKQVEGMIQINGITQKITSIIDADNFEVAIDSTYFYPYSSGGVAVTDTGIPPIQQAGSQFFNTPWQNTFT